MILQTTKLRAELIVASDLHIQSRDDQRLKLLLQALADVEGPSTLVLNGDVFDFFYGGAEFFHEHYQGLFQALHDLSRAAVRVLFVEGNHEFHTQLKGWPGIEVITAQDLMLVLEGGQKLAITHGDLLLDDWKYRAFRTVLKSKLVKAIVDLIPKRWLNWYAVRYASLSRKADRYRQLDHARVLQASETWLAMHEADHGIIGHFHFPYAEPRAQGRGLLLSVASWDQPNLLLFRDGQFWRVWLAAGGGPYRWEPVRSMLGPANNA